MLKKTGTLLHESAAVHASILAPILDGYEVDESAMRAALPPARQLTPTCIVDEDYWPTRVVQMDIDDGLISDLKRELLLRDKIDTALASLRLTTYSPVSTQFENSFLFLPSCQRFYRRNRQIIETNFPSVNTVTVNAFIVPPNTPAFGVHNAGSIGFQVPALARRGYGYPEKHMSFHTAVTATPLERQPLCVFEDSVPESPNTSHLYEQIRRYDLTPEEVGQVEKALYLHDSSQLSAVDLLPIRNFLLCKYWEKRYAQEPEKAAGYYCDAKPGQALFFDNYRAHGDSTLPLSPEPRVTIDMRCFSKVSYPSPSITSGVDLLLDPANRDRQKAQKRAAIECLLLLLGYEGIGEFMQLVYGDPDIDPFEIMTDLQFSIYNAGPYYAMDQDLEPHYERVEKLYERIEKEGDFRPPENALAALGSLATA